ncbi:hypothetical protein [Arthrobacter sp. MMS24-S77]
MERPPFAFMRGGVSLFASAYLVMALLGGTLSGVLLAVVVFSIAEAFFTPILNTVFAGIGGHRSQLELFNMRQISTSIGESVGSLVGGAVFTVSQAAGWNTAYWGALAVLAISVVGVVRKWPQDTELNDLHQHDSAQASDGNVSQ